MRRHLLLPAIFLLTIAAIARFSPTLGRCETPADPNELARAILDKNPVVAAGAIAQLRQLGPEGLLALQTQFADTIVKYRSAEANAQTAVGSDADWQKIKTALDQVGGQYDCYASRLFWYTDLNEAEAAAEREHKPILSLRLLGKLTDEYSCANSRFFRTTLYANDEVSRVLRERFILHWKSVRPVPKVTIDFGDGRKLERTLTGNSIHYVLDCHGQVIDALPGLYGPKAFLRALEPAEKIIDESASLPPIKRGISLAAYHRRRFQAIEVAWNADLLKLGVSMGTPMPHVLPKAAAQARAPQTAPPTAAQAAPTAYSKYVVEAPIVSAAAPPTLEEATTDTVWNRIAALHSDDGTLDAASVALMASQHPTAAAAGRIAISKGFVENPLVRMVRAFQGTVALDTVRNEYLLHRQIHQWLAAQPSPNLDQFNERVYSDLFLTPSSDPWLGLMPADSYSALQNNGVVK